MKKAEEMSMEELRLAAIEGLGIVPTDPAASVEPPINPVKPQDEKKPAKKVNYGDALGGDGEEEIKPQVQAAEEVEEEEEPQEFIVREEIDLEDGSGSQVFIGRGESELEAQKDFSRKLLVAQKNATKKIREQQAALNTRNTKSAQAQQDEDYILREEYKKDPIKASKQIAARAVAEQQQLQAQHLANQVSFVNSHPEYVADPKTGNGDRLTSEFRRLYPEATIFTLEGLEKAYQNLKRDGLLRLKNEEADVTTTEQGEESERIAQPKPEATQSRGKKKSSTARGSAPTVKTGPSEADLQKLSTEELAAKTREAFLQAARQE